MNSTTHHRAAVTRQRAINTVGQIGDINAALVADDVDRRPTRQHPAPRHSARRVAFSCEAPRAEGVRLVGDFNGWDLAATPMRRTEAGRWVTNLALNLGSYSYLFVVDGNLMLDRYASATIGNDQVSLITVG